MLSDADISENAAYALHFEVASQLIRVAVKNGWLTLTGEVADEAEKEAAGPPKRKPALSTLGLLVQLERMHHFGCILRIHVAPESEGLGKSIHWAILARVDRIQGI